MFASFVASVFTSCFALIAASPHSGGRTASRRGVRWLAALALACGGLAVSVNFHAVGWSSAASLSAARAEHSATLLPSGKVLVAGGFNGSTLSSAELYDPVSSTWSAAGSLAAESFGHSATLLPSGKVLVSGGHNNVSGTFSSAELYDPTSNSWSPAGSLATPRYYHSATLLPSDKVLVAGGFNGSTPSSAELYDPVSSTWSAAGGLATPRY